MVTVFGSLGRNAFRGPFQQNWDFSLLKNLPITEHTVKPRPFAAQGKQAAGLQSDMILRLWPR